jgi:predicted acyl esterase
MARAGHSVQAESNGMAVFAHEFSHILGITDNYGNAYATDGPGGGPLRDLAGPFEILGRGQINGPYGTHQRWRIPAKGATQPAGVALRERLYLGTIDEDDYVELPQEDLDAMGMFTTTITAREVMRDGDITGINLVLDKPTGETYADNSSGTCRRTTTQYGGDAGGVPWEWDCDGGGWDNYTLEVIQQMGTDSFVPDSGVYLNKTKNANTNPFIWTIDAVTDPLNIIDFTMPDGTPVPVTRGDQRQLSDALFHAGTNSGSRAEYVDEANGLHFYFTNARRDGEGVLQYDVAVRSLRDVGPQRRGVDVGAGVVTGSTDNEIVQVVVPVSNTGAAVRDDAANSDIYRLSASVSGSGWEVVLPEEFAIVPQGVAVDVPVYLHKVDAGASLSGVSVTVVAVSENSVVGQEVSGQSVTVVPGGVRPRTLPKFDAVDGHALDVFTDRTKWIFQQAWVEVPGVDTDADGWNDLVHVDWTRQGETDSEDLDVPVILAMSPYYAGTTNVQNHNMYTEVGEDPDYSAAPPFTLRGTNTRNVRIGDANGRPYQYAISSANIVDWVPRGYMVAHAENLGAGWSEGCPTAGDLNEQRAAKATAEFFAGTGVAYTDETRTQRISVKDWVTGKVGMFGTSYVGALPIMAAVAGAEGLVAISPDSSTGSWYEYYRANGSYKAPGGYPGEDTDLHAKFNYSSMVFSHADDPAVCDPYFESLEQAQDRASGNYSDYWEVRNYAKTIKDWNVAVLLEGGFRDWNVMFKHQWVMLEQLQAHNKNWQAWFHQQGHGQSHPTSLIRNLFFTHYLYGGAPAGGEQKVWVKPSTYLERHPGSYTWGNVEPEEFPTWPVPGAEDVTFQLAPVEGQELGTLSFDANLDVDEVQSFVDDTTGFPNSDVRIPDSNPRENEPSDFGFTTLESGTAVAGHRLIYVSDPVREDVRLSGTPSVSLNMALLNRTKANLSVLLVSYPALNPADSDVRDVAQIVSRGWMDPQNRTSLWVDDPVTPGEFYQLTWTLDPKDYIVTAGSRLALVVLSTDPGYTVRPQNGTELALKPGLSTVTLPLVGGELAFKANLAGTLASIEAVPSARSIQAGESVSVSVSGTGSQGASFGDLTRDAVLTSTNTSDVVQGNTVQATQTGTRTVHVEVEGVTTSFQVDVVPAPVDVAAGLVPSFSQPELNGQSMLAATAGGSLTVAAATAVDEFGNTITLPAPVLASSNPSDVIRGTTITFGAAGLRTLTVTSGGLTKTYPVYVGAREVPPPSTPTPPPTTDPVPPTTAPTAPPNPFVEARVTAPVISAVLSSTKVTTAKHGTLTIHVAAPGTTVHRSLVTVVVGSKSVMRRLNAQGDVTVTLPRVAPGHHRVLVIYTSTDGGASHTTSAGWITVTKPKPTKVTVTGPAKGGTTTAKTKLAVKVTHPDVPSPTGKVIVRVTKNGKSVATKTTQLRTTHKGKTTITLPKITTPGTYSVKATYTGSTTLAKKGSKTLKLTIK